MQIEHETEGSPAPEDTEASVVDVSQVQDPAAAAAPGDVDTAASSPADAKDPPKSMLDVIKDVVEPAKAPEEASPSDPEKPVSDEVQKEGEAEAELSDEDLAKLPFGKHPRFRRLLSDNKGLKDKVAGYETQVQELEGPATQYRAIDSFLRENEIEAPEFVRLMKVGALIKQDPEEARKEVLQVLFELDEMTGYALSPDLRADIEAGHITEDRGRELSIARAKAARMSERATVATEREQTTRQATAERDVGQAMGNAVADWESRTRGKDPDFAAKEAFVADRVKALNVELGRPKSVEEAVQRVTKAYEDVTKQLRGVVPPKPEVRRSPESASSSNVVPAPKTMLEAVRSALG